MGLDIFRKHDNIKTDILHNKDLIISTNKRITALVNRIKVLEERVFVDTMSKEELVEYIKTKLNPINENITIREPINLLPNYENKDKDDA